MVTRNVYWKNLPPNVKVTGRAAYDQECVQSRYIAHLEGGDAVVNWQYRERAEAQRFLNNLVRRNDE